MIGLGAEPKGPAIGGQRAKAKNRTLQKARASSVSIESKRGPGFLVLTRFLSANRVHFAGKRYRFTGSGRAPTTRPGRHYRSPRGWRRTGNPTGGSYIVWQPR